jgi:hypothetical protein
MSTKIKPLFGKVTTYTREEQATSLCLYLLTVDSASVCELEIKGFKDPAGLVFMLRGWNVPVWGVHQPTKIIDNHIVYAHYRYKLQLDDLLRRLPCNI